MTQRKEAASRAGALKAGAAASLFMVATPIWSGSTAVKVDAATAGWNIIASPNSTASDNFLFGTTCFSAGQCWAVGWSDSPPSYEAQALTEEWGGANWRIVGTPSVGTVNLLQSVTCATSVDCWAVGYDVMGGTDQTLIEQYTGSVWSQAPSPNPTASNAVLTAVTCLDTSDCWAVGYSWASGGPLEPLSEHYDGTQWGVVASPTTPTSETPESVTCADADHCWMVGDALIEQWNGAAWSIVMPASALPPDTNLTGVACVGIDDCWAVGSATSSGNPAQTLVVQFAGTTWSVQNSPDAGAGANNLQQVSCVSLDSCTAAGTYAGVSAEQTLIEQYNGATWSIVASPNTSASANNILLGVSCSNGECWATGYSSLTSNSGAKTLTEEYTSSTTVNCTAGTWIVDTANLLPSMGSGSLSGATVASPSLAWAVGTFGSNNASGSLIMKWTGGTAWSVVGTGGVGAQLNAVTAFGAKSAFAVGYLMKGNTPTPLISHWNGSTWGRTVLPVPGGATSAELEAVGGASATNVWAVGFLTEQSSTNNLLLEHYNGSTWTRFTLAKGTDSSISANAVLAFSTSDVWLLGDYGDDGGLTDQGYMWHFNGRNWTDQHIWPVTDPPSSAFGLAGSTDHDLWTVTYNYTLAADILEHWNGVSWSQVGAASPDVNLSGIAEGAHGSASLWSVGNFGDGPESGTTYLGENGGQVLAPSLSGYFADIATGYGLAFAVGGSEFGNPVIEASCD